MEQTLNIMFFFFQRNSTAVPSNATPAQNPLQSMFSGGGMNGNMPIPQSLEQLLERQWEQGSQFLMEQAQHFDSEYESHIGS